MAKMWLTRVHGGRYLITLFEPVIAKIRGTDHLDAFERVGEPIAIRYLCEGGVKSFIGEHLPPLTPTRVELSVTILDKPNIKA